jgi:hypothetical protein
VSQATALGLTIAAELPWWVLGLVALRLTRWPAALALGIAVNLLTHPVLWWALAPHPGLTRFTLAELAVWAVETLTTFLVLRRGLPLLAVLSLGANATSVAIGLLLD